MSDANTSETTDSTVLDGQDSTDAQSQEKSTEESKDERTILDSSKEETAEKSEAESEAEDSEAEKKEEKPESQAPEKYAEFKYPEGMEFMSETLTGFEETAHELDLSQEGAQKMIDLAAQHVQFLGEKQAESWAEQRKTWVEEVKGDPDFGGSHFDETVERANRVLRNFGDTGLVTFLKDSGIGDNAGLVRMFARIDKAISEDRAIDGKPGEGTGQRSLEKTLYPGMGS